VINFVITLIAASTRSNRVLKHY